MAECTNWEALSSLKVRPRAPTSALEAMRNFLFSTSLANTSSWALSSSNFRSLAWDSEPAASDLPTSSADVALSVATCAAN